MSAYLGIDLGTSGTKSLVCRADGTILATATAEHPISHPHPGWSEQNPADWWTSTLKSARQAIAESRIKPGELKGIGLSGQMHGSVFLDDNKEVLRPALLWNDQRTEEECRDIEKAAGGRKALIQMVSNPAFTGFTAPKILWVRKNEPAIYARIRHILLPKDYLRLKLTGELATEVSDASGTLLLNVVERRWHTDLLSKLQIDPSFLPRCVESDEITGMLTAEAANELGVQQGVPVIGGAGDQSASALGNGIVKPGIISATIGTSGVVFAHAEKPETHPEGKVHTMCHAVRGAWHQMGVVLSAGGSLQWFRNQLCQDLVQQASQLQYDPYELIMQAIEKAPAGSEGLYFAPYLTGERHPWSDPQIRGGWVGLTVRHQREHLARAVVEGITFAMRDCLEVMRDLGVKSQQIRLSGGGARSPIWRQMQADIYGQTVAQINAHEGPAFGVALLAMVGTGAYRTVPEACEATIRVTEERQPAQATARKYDGYYDLYRSLYPAMAEICHRINAVEMARSL
ncbi:MAG TPA: xylulokinase [Gemmatales bacterium]|nr:xylulokinase [Gemmatales bacterium]